MPSAMNPVGIPDELRPGKRKEEQSERRPPQVPLTFLISLLGLIVGTAMVGFGVGTWAHHPGAGIAAAGLVIVVVAVLIGFQV